MKPTGRRRFRKMNARYRRRGSETVRDVARRTSAGKARKIWWGRAPLPLHPRPFTPRSLVGMSMGARKRLARVDCMGGEVQREMPRRIWLMWWRIHRKDGSASAEPETYQTDRRRYRLGERLRPCPGCCAVRYKRVRCGKCGVRGVRLYRPYGNFYRPKDNVCTQCNPVNPKYGRPEWHVPLVLGPQGQVWGACTDKPKDFAIWEAQPEAGQACKTCDGSGVLRARR